MKEKKGDVWDFFDSVQIITTHHSKRLEPLLENLKNSSFNLENIVINKSLRQPTDYTKKCDMFKIGFVKDESCCDKACQSCNNNHFRVIQNCYNTNQQYILILEDDARFKLPLNKDKINKAIQWLKKNNNWDIFYFGSLPFLSYPINTFIMRSYSPFLAHCYCLNRKGMKKILDAKSSPNYHYDVKLTHISNLQKYVLFPSICHQDAPNDYQRHILSSIVSFKNISSFVEILSYYFIFIILLFFFKKKIFIN